MTNDKTEQGYWRFAEHPYLEYRETIESLISYKTHQHASLSIGAIISGKTALTFPYGKKMLKQGDHQYNHTLYESQTVFATPLL